MPTNWPYQHSCSLRYVSDSHIPTAHGASKQRFLKRNSDKSAVCGSKTVERSKDTTSATNGCFMKIGILQTGKSPEQLAPAFGDYGNMFERMLDGRGFTFTIYDILEMEFPKSISEQDGWIITGSRYGAYEDHEWIPPLEALIRDLHTAKAPMIGVCFGHQIIAQALGGRVEKFDGGWSVGRVEYDAGGEKLPLFAWHQDQVTKAPEGAKTVASTNFCAHAALTIGDHIYTIQPHPEFTADFVTGLAETRAKGIVPDPQRLAAINSTKYPVATGYMADHFETFLKQGQTHG